MNEALSIVMISLNEEKSVGKVIDDIKHAVPGAEILLVDSSADKTAEIAKSKGARVIKQIPPKGYGLAMELALKAASGDIIVTMDCDNTYPTQTIPELAKLITEQNYDIVNTTRVLKKPQYMPLLNFIGNRFFAFCTFLRHGIKTTDVHSGMRAYTRKLVHSLKWEADGPALPVELLIRSVKNGYKFVEVPIEYNERIGITTLKKFSSALWTFKRIFNKKYFS